MQLVQEGGRFVFRCEFEERATPKSAGCTWDSKARIWHTSDTEVARRLQKFADYKTSQLLKTIVDERKHSIAESRAKDADIVIPSPDGLAYLPYQKAGVSFMIKRPRVLLGDAMGLGKTIQVIGLMNAVDEIRKALIVCPARLRLNWYRELTKWLVRKRPMAVVNAGDRWPYGFEVIIINYDIVERYDEEIKRHEWDLFAADEAHYLRNKKTIRARHLFGGPEIKERRDPDTKEILVKARPKTIPVRTKRAVMMTGTPIPSRVKECFSIIHYLDPGTWSDARKFEIRYCGGHQTRFGWDAKGAQNLQELQTKLRSTIMIRRRKEEVLTELPPKRRQVIELPVSDAELAEKINTERVEWEKRESLLEELAVAVELAKASEDETVYRESVAKLKAAQEIAFTEMARIRKETAVAKIPYLIEHLKDNLESGEKILFFGHHHAVLDAIQEAFPGISVKVDGRLTGKAGAIQSQDAVDRFQQDDKIRLFIGGILATGVGLTLTKSSHVVFGELDWVPGNVTQAEDRTHRIGQLNSVLIQHLVLEGSIDAKMARTLVAKQDVADRALDKDIVEADEAQQIIMPSEHTAPRVALNRQKLHKEALSITPSQMDAVHAALRILAAACDGARRLDGTGFNRIDARIGTEFAQQGRLTPKQAVIGRKIAQRYSRQLDAGLIERMAA